eukprot:TRINITY_DN67599_c7_g6_i1.p1 TRINITY_DN67599_c7_g6~~TRINITY_DN67599_c7_g6_i1.p1  ORF type:complete len:226 (+),score=21.25 TRINITY_DN67599_c7_g6_i1:158-835(+)
MPLLGGKKDKDKDKKKEKDAEKDSDEGDEDDNENGEEEEEDHGALGSASAEIAAPAKGKEKKKKQQKVKWKWDMTRSNADDWIISSRSFLKRSSDGEIKYLFGDQVLSSGLNMWGLKVGHSGFLYIGIVDAEKFRGWRDTWMHTANHCYCVSYAGGIYYANGKRLGTAKRIRDGSVVWVAVDCEKQQMTMTRGKDKVLCQFKSIPKKCIPWVGIGCANTAYELKF